MRYTLAKMLNGPGEYLLTGLQSKVLVESQTSDDLVELHGIQLFEQYYIDISLWYKMYFFDCTLYANSEWISLFNSKNALYDATP